MDLQKKGRRRTIIALLVTLAAGVMFLLQYGIAVGLIAAACTGVAAAFAVTAMNERDRKALRAAIRIQSMPHVIEALKQVAPDAVYTPEGKVDVRLIGALFPDERALIKGRECIEMTYRGHACTICEFDAVWDGPGDSPDTVFEGYAMVIRTNMQFDEVVGRKAAKSEGRWRCSAISATLPNTSLTEQLLPDEWLRTVGEQTGRDARAIHAGSGVLVMSVERSRDLLRFYADATTPEKMADSARSDVERIVGLFDLVMRNHALFGNE